MDLLERLAELLELINAPDDIEDAEALAVELGTIFVAIRAGEVELPEGATVLETVRPIGDAVINLRALDFLRAVADAEVEAELDAIANQTAPPAAASDTEGDAAAAAAAAGGDGEGEGDGEGGEGAEGEGAGDGTEDGAAGGGDGDAAGGDGGGEGDGEQAGATAGGEKVPVAAAGRVPLGAGRRHQPNHASRKPAATQRPANVQVVRAEGGAITPDELPEVMYHGWESVGPRSGKRVWAQIVHTFDDAHTLSSRDDSANERKVQALVAGARSDEAWENIPLTASGLGWCTPSVIDYSSGGVQALAVRPVAAALPEAQISRGGTQLRQQRTLADVTGITSLSDTHDPDDTAVSTWTEADDIAFDPDDDGTWKPIQGQDCATWNNFRAYMVVARRKFSNMAAEADPEDVRDITELTQARYARVADTLLLEHIKQDAGTTNVTQPAELLGSVRDFVELVIRLVEFMRSAERATDGMGGGPRIRLMAPAWSLGMNQADLVRTPSFASGANRLVVPRTELVGMLTDAGVQPSFYIDSPLTGPSQILPKQTDNTEAKDWQCNVQFGLWFEGHFIHGVGRTIDLGTLRDVDLVKANDYETFMEGSENLLARRGPEALWVTQKLVPSGAYQASVDVSGDIDCIS